MRKPNQKYILQIPDYVKTYFGPIEYKDGRTISSDGGFRTEYNIKDHLGSVRLTYSDINGDGTIEYEDELLQENHFYPFGMAWEGNRLMPEAPNEVNPYQYNGKEMNSEIGLDWLDYGARWYDPSIGRWNAVDPLAEQYSSISSYAYVANNPLKYVDPNGKEIIVPKKYRSQFSADLNKAFGGNSKSLTFKDDKLVLSGNKKDFLQGMSKEQKKLFNGLNKLMKSKKETTIAYEDKYTLTVGKEKKEVDVMKEFGGGVYSKTDNTIVIANNLDPSVDVTLDVFPFDKEQEVKQNSTSILFHEIGEANTSNLEFRGEVIDYENLVREVLGMDARPYDLNHSRTIKTTYKDE